MRGSMNGVVIWPGCDAWGTRVMGVGGPLAARRGAGLLADGSTMELEPAFLPSLDIV